MNYVNIAVTIPIKKNEVMLNLEKELQNFFLKLEQPYVMLREDCSVNKEYIKDVKDKIEKILEDKEPFKITINRLAYDKKKGLFFEVKPNKELERLHHNLIEMLNEDKNFLGLKKLKFTPDITITTPSYNLENNEKLIEWVKKFGKDFSFEQKINLFKFIEQENDSKLENVYFLNKTAEGMKKDLFKIIHEGFKLVLDGPISLALSVFTAGKSKSYAKDALERMEKQAVLIIKNALEMKSINEEINEEVMNEYIKTDEIYKFCVLQEKDERKKGKNPLSYVPVVAYLIEGLKKAFKEKLKMVFKTLKIEGKSYHEVLKKRYPTMEDAKKDLLKELDFLKRLVSFSKEKKFDSHKFAGVYNFLKIINMGYERTELVWSKMLEEVFTSNWSEINKRLKGYKKNDGPEKLASKDNLLNLCCLLSNCEARN